MLHKEERPLSASVSSFRRRAAVAVAAVSLTAVVATDHPVSADKPAQYSILLFTRTAGFAHPSIPSAIAAIETLGDNRGFEVVATTDPNRFNPAELSKYAAVVFVSTTGNVLPLPEQ